MTDEYVKFELRLPSPQGLVNSSVQIKATKARLVDLVPAAQHLTNLAAEQAAAFEQSQGRRVTCDAGCGACCRQLVLVSIPEVFYVAERANELAAERQEVIRHRFDAIVSDLAARGLTERLLDPELSGPMPYFPAAEEYFRLGHACPFLEEESCSIHPVRPVPCRDYNVSSAPELCRNPYAEPVQKVPMPAALSAPLARLCAELTGDDVQLVPLSLALVWAEQHTALDERSWPGEFLLKSLLQQLGREEPPT